MKKAIAGIIALTVIFGTLTGCGKKAAKDASDNTATTKASQEATTAEAVEETTAETAAETVEEGSYERLIRDFIDAYVGNERKKTLLMQYPEGYMDIVKVTMNGDDDDEMTVNDSMTEEEAVTYLQHDLYMNFNEDEKLRFKGVISAEPILGAEADKIKQVWGLAKGLEAWIKENGGPDKIDRYELDEIESDLMGEDLTDTCELEECYHVTFAVEYAKTGEVSEATIDVFRMAGEGWKVNVDRAKGDVRKEKSNSEIADSAYRAMNTAIIRLEEETMSSAGMDKPFIVGSDDNMDTDLSEGFDADAFRKETALYMDDINDMKWFAVVYKDFIIYVAADRSEGSEPAGTYPADSVLSGFGEGGGGEFEENSEPKTLKELYGICADLVEKY